MSITRGLPNLNTRSVVILPTYELAVEFANARAKFWNKRQRIRLAKLRIGKVNVTLRPRLWVVSQYKHQVVKNEHSQRVWRDDPLGITII